MNDNGLVKKILILAANPKGTSPLRLDEEMREIEAGLERAKDRDQFILEKKWAVRPRDIQRAMLDIDPQIVHFSGHGEGEKGLVFEDEMGRAKLVDGEALAGLFELFADKVECVVLNGCYSQVQAEEIAQHIPYVIGMSQAIGDRAAIEFAVGFYDALGAGRPVEFAYKLGCSAIRLAGIAENLTPVLIQKSELVGTATPPNGEVKPQPAQPKLTSSSENQRIEIFFSYAHEDEALRDELAKHLKLLGRQGVITAWHDRQITAGTEWEGQIDEHLETAKVILLLVSADFLASDYCYDVELKRAMERHEANEASVIPVILREVDWKGASFGKLQALPKNAEPVTNWSNPDQAFADIARGIRRAVEELTGKK
ncbi:MAG TPA: TIR domain-containing protein [Cyanothece sp. UBA12306]|nr:TIR domain-containing protein [Cyanothece sp. UBA12306]